MIKTNTIIKDNDNNPAYVVIEYQEYLRILDELEDPEGIEKNLQESCSEENKGEGKPLGQILKELENEEK